ncbi:hypothetical protein C1752_01711 [Acaryochloris thomasi RCC1774]|uniref:Uncharacterized protein n=1 Tax=Acaryochloris thomasi RCC1774 TaxID=1764569 RepID=A0A2W1K0X5_9CYAN|nr:hypothetical protein [Acaryochloris thomasi]PZD73857.1 hypothetical protein C1752_01711 [Acaryochloris thomasi RCC1774]
MRRSAVGVTLTLLAIALSGCNSGSELKSNAISKDTKAVPSDTVEATSVPEVVSIAAVDQSTTAPATVALIRPTDPEERVRTIQSGRADPFRPLVSPAQPQSRPGSGVRPSAGGSGGRTAPGARPTTRSTAATRGSSTRLSPPSTATPKSSPSTSPGKAVLPPLPAPEPTAAKEVQVQGIVVMAGRPQAIVQAPEEKTARTISSGDRVANGRVLLKGFDMSNPVAPKAIFEEAGMEVAIGVGQEPIVLASASSQAPVRGLYKVGLN